MFTLQLVYLKVRTNKSAEAIVPDLQYPKDTNPCFVPVAHFFNRSEICSNAHVETRTLNLLLRPNASGCLGPIQSQGC